MQDEIVPYFKYPNEYLCAKYYWELPRYVKDIRRRYKKLTDTTDSAETLLCRALIEVHVMVLTCAVSISDISLDILDKTQHLLCKLNVNCDVKSRHGFITWSWEETNKLLETARMWNAFARMCGIEPLKYSN